MKWFLVMLLCVVLSIPMLALAQNQPTTANEPAAATTPAAQMPGMMGGGTGMNPGMGGGMGGGMGMRGGMGGGMQMKTSAQEMMGYLKLCDEVKNNPTDMEKITKWTAASADQVTSPGMTGMAGMATARGAAMKDTGAMLADTLTMMKGCKGIKDNKSKMDNIDAMIAKAKVVAEGKTSKAEGAMEESKEKMKGAAGEAKEEAKEGVKEEAKEGAAQEAREEAKEDGTNPQAMRRQMMQQSMTLQKMIPETAKMMKGVEAISQNAEASKGLDAIVTRGEQMQERMQQMMQMRQQQPNGPAGAAPAPGAVTPAAGAAQ